MDNERSIPPSTTAEAPPQPPPVPRPLTKRARLRAWTEPRVRFWWILAIVLSAVIIGLGAEQGAARHRENWLIHNGLQVEAQIIQVGGVELPRRFFPPESVAELHFTTPDGKLHRVVGALAGRKQEVETGTTVPLRIDPNDPENWTARTEPSPLNSILIGAAIPTPALLLVVLVSIVKSARIRRTWRSGEQTLALVVEARHNALAPRSTLARCTPADDRDNRAMSVYVPSRVEAGDLLWLLAPPGRFNQAVAASWFE